MSVPVYFTLPVTERCHSPRQSSTGLGDGGGSGDESSDDDDLFCESGDLSDNGSGRGEGFAAAEREQSPRGPHEAVEAEAVAGEDASLALALRLAAEESDTRRQPDSLPNKSCMQCALTGRDPRAQTEGRRRRRGRELRIVARSRGRGRRTYAQLFASSVSPAS